MNTHPIYFGLRPVLTTAQEFPRTVLPLKSVRYRFVARAGIAEVEMIQVYCQENSQPLDCEYLFPLPADAAVYRCEASIDGRILRARVEERGEARKLAEEKRVAGHRTALVESERDNLFTLNLGNLQPGDVVEVKLAYLQPLRRLAKQVALDLPLCPGIRYIPGNTLLRSNRGSGVTDDTDQVPDASRITPPRIDGQHPDVAFVELDGYIEDPFLDGCAFSPSHRLTCESQGEAMRVTLTRGGEIPDQDLALRWNERSRQQTSQRGWITSHEQYQYALLELRAPDTVSPGVVVGQDVYFLMDRSGSMDGLKWGKAARALRSCVEVLNPNDRVSVTLFGSSFQDFDAEPTSPETLLADSKFGDLPRMGTLGGTEMAPALRHVLDLVDRHSRCRSAVLILVTDAEIGNEREIVALMGGHPSLPVHCFGIDVTLNDSLLLDLVRQQGGTFHALHPQEDVQAFVAKLGNTLRQPVLVNLHVPDGWELASGAIPNLYAGQTRHVSLRARSARSVQELAIPARDQADQNTDLLFQLRPVEDLTPYLLWCKERLLTLVASNKPSAAITLSKESNLICRFTAFVAWDEQERVAVASHRLVQPSVAGLLGMMDTAMLQSVKFDSWRPGDYPEGSALVSRLVSEEKPLPPIPELVVIPDAIPLRKELHQVHCHIRMLVDCFPNLLRNEPWLKLLTAVLEWLVKHPNRKSIEAVRQLLRACERDLEKLGVEDPAVEARMRGRIEDFLQAAVPAPAPSPTVGSSKPQ